MRKIIVIVGPTASGKTAASLALARAVKGEVVSADSRQVYRGLDIGSGKVTREEARGVPHHLLDVADPEDAFSAADFSKKARAAIAEIVSRDRVPIVVGGTGFYIDALLGRASLPEVPPNPALRARLKSLPTKRLLLKLARLDVRRASTIDPYNRVRLIRAIEIATALGKVPVPKARKRYDVLWLGIALPKEELEKRIHARLLARMKEGMLEEAKRLHAEGLSYERMEELGLEYRYLARLLEGKLTREEMLAALETEIRKYAKRQMTWFKRNKEIRWFSPGETDAMKATVKDFLSR
jgi:tRNA dimethylallyltransferase